MVFEIGHITFEWNAFLRHTAANVRAAVFVLGEGAVKDGSIKYPLIRVTIASRFGPILKRAVIASARVSEEQRPDEGEQGALWRHVARV